jgi:hypothetical protein
VIIRTLLTGSFLLLAVACLGADVVEEEPPRHRAVAYYAHFSPDRMIDILRFNNPHIAGDSRLAALAYSYRLSEGHTALSWELEAQAVQHFGRQNHQEINALLTARWNRFPWDHHVNTSAAFGWGQSYAFKVPVVEPRSGSDEVSTRLLNYLLVELDFAPPTRPEWGLVLRLHHRSGVFGMYNGVNGGSNFVGAGLRYAF